MSDTEEMDTQETGNGRVELIARRIFWGLGAILIALLGMMISAGFWAGSLHEIVGGMADDVKWLVRDKIPSIEEKVHANESQIERGVLPRAEADIEKLREDVLRLQVESEQ